MSDELSIMEIEDLDDLDGVTAEVVEACRKDLGLSPLEFAGSLKWSLRKYQRVLEAARGDEMPVGRDVALAVWGLAQIMSAKGQVQFLGADFSLPPENGRFLDGRTFPRIMQELKEDAGKWTAEVAPPLMILLARKAMEARTISYGSAATMLEDRGLTKRVWPRTQYGYPLGLVSRAMMALEEETWEEIPLLSVIVVNGSGEPGPGIDDLIISHLQNRETDVSRKELNRRLRTDRHAVIEALQQEAFEFKNWPGVLRALLSDK